MSIQSETLTELRDHRHEVQGHIKETRDRLIKLETMTEGLPDRVTALERFNWKFAGGLTALVTLATWVARHMGL